MTKNEIFKLISEYIAEGFEIKIADITLEAKLYEDLDLDSIDAIDLIVKLQELTKEKIAPEKFKKVRTISDVVDVVYEIIKK